MIFKLDKGDIKQIFEGYQSIKDFKKISKNILKLTYTEPKSAKDPNSTQIEENDSDQSDYNDSYCSSNSSSNNFSSDKLFKAKLFHINESMDLVEIKIDIKSERGTHREPSFNLKL